MTKRSSPAGSGRGRRGASERKVQSCSTSSEAMPGSFWTCGSAPSLDPYPGSATDHLIVPGDPHTLQHIQVHFGVDFQADFEDVMWHDVTLTWNHTKDHNHSRKLCFHHPGNVPVIRGNPAMVRAVITWIVREHEVYSGVSPISLVEHCVPFRHDRRLLSLLGFVYNWPTSRWSATKKRKPVFIKRKWNHVFSKATILSSHPVYRIYGLLWKNYLYNFCTFLPVFINKIFSFLKIQFRRYTVSEV